MDHAAVCSFPCIAHHIRKMSSSNSFPAYMTGMFWLRPGAIHTYLFTCNYDRPMFLIPATSSEDSFDAASALGLKHWAGRRNWNWNRSFAYVSLKRNGCLLQMQAFALAHLFTVGRWNWLLSGWSSRGSRFDWWMQEHASRYIKIVVTRDCLLTRYKCFSDLSALSVKQYLRPQS